MCQSYYVTGKQKYKASAQIRGSTLILLET